jgi:thiosulfate/3-mercaptopyruvate sulfurtransferase
MRNIVDSQWLAARLYESDIVIADCKFDLADPEAGQQAYDREHIPGAFYFHMEKDLSGPKGAHGGRHPLPSIEQLSRKLSKAGIDDKITVIAYDDQGGAMASRFWWLLHYLGHRQTYILNGGFSKWKAGGYPVTSEAPVVLAPRSFQPNPQLYKLITMEEVKQRLGKTETILIDSREENRYRGIEEPIDKTAGHIPGAVNDFWKNGLDDGGGWAEADMQRRRFAHIDSDKEVIVYCGSGITACPNVIALEEAGFGNVKLYAGSWSDWISYPENAIATKKE